MCTLLLAVAYAPVFAVPATRGVTSAQFERGRAFNLQVAIVLAVTVTLVLFVSSILTAALGRAGQAETIDRHHAPEAAAHPA